MKNESIREENKKKVDSRDGRIRQIEQELIVDGIKTALNRAKNPQIYETEKSLILNSDISATDTEIACYADGLYYGLHLGRLLKDFEEEEQPDK